jgi:hypothetical protein
MPLPQQQQDTWERNANRASLDLRRLLSPSFLLLITIFYTARLSFFIPSLPLLQILYALPAFCAVFLSGAERWRLPPSLPPSLPCQLRCINPARGVETSEFRGRTSILAPRSLPSARPPARTLPLYSSSRSRPTGKLKFNQPGELIVVLLLALLTPETPDSWPKGKLH